MIVDTEQQTTATAVARQNQAPVLAVRDLTRCFGNLRAVDQVSFSAWPGQVIGFIGPNGAGKTTTMRILATLDLPDAGDAFINGHSVIDEPDLVRHSVGFMPDAFGKYSNMNVVEYLDFYARAYGLRDQQRRDAIEHVLVFTELRQLADKQIRTLSKGMSQRLGLGRTLIHDPQLLILDEPAAGLDPRARVELRELVRLLATEMDKTVLISSHILTELGEICDSVVIIEAGRVLADGSLKDIRDLQRQRRGSTGSSTILISLLQEDDMENRYQAFARWLLEQAHVQKVHTSQDGVAVDFSGDQQAVYHLLTSGLSNEFKICEFYGKTESLEDAFMNITEGITQ